MLPSSRYSRRTRRDRLSISVIPERSLDTEPRSAYLHWLFGESSEIDINSRLVEDVPDGVDDGTGYGKADAVVMREVAAWLELHEQDDIWVSRRKHAGKILPTTSQLLAQLKDSDNLPHYSPNGDAGFDALVQAIALQLLASCYTYLPASSANHLPLFQQRTATKLVTALRAHSLYRLSPAAGHHARPPSETSAWPGLYSGPYPEDTLAETVSRRRRSAKRSSEYIPHFAASGWTDGPNEIARQRCSSPSGRRSSSSVETGIFTRLICQPSTPRNPRRTHNNLFSGAIFSRKKKEQGSPDKSPSRKMPTRKMTTQTVQRIPSKVHLRQTQSNPRMRDEASPVHPTSESSPNLARRTSSDPSIGNSFRYKYEIPEIRHVWTIPEASYEAESVFSVRGCGRGDMIFTHEYVSEIPVARRPSIESPSPFSAFETSAEKETRPRTYDGYFNMGWPALLQEDNNWVRHGNDEDNERFKFSSPDDNNLYTESKDWFEFDDNGQTAADRQNSLDYGTETGHNSQEIPYPHPKHISYSMRDNYGSKSSRNAYPTPNHRIHDCLARGDSQVYNVGNGPAPASDSRLTKAMTRQYSSDHESSGSDIEWDRRRRSINNETGAFSGELATKFRSLIEDIKEKEHSKELGDGGSSTP